MVISLFFSTVGLQMIPSLDCFAYNLHYWHKTWIEVFLIFELVPDKEFFHWQSSQTPKHWFGLWIFCTSLLRCLNVLAYAKICTFKLCRILLKVSNPVFLPSSFPFLFLLLEYLGFYHFFFYLAFGAAIEVFVR